MATNNSQVPTDLSWADRQKITELRVISGNVRTMATVLTIILVIQIIVAVISFLPLVLSQL